MAIGVFDSGVGGLTVHRELVARFPTRDFIYLGDQGHAPYGGRGGEDIAVFSEPCPGLAGLIELGAPAEELKVVIDDHVDALRRRIGRHPDKAILGCTHYEIVAELFASALPPGTVLIEQPTAVADALERYFARHPEYDLGDSGRRDFLTTGQAGPQSELVAQFWGAPVTFERA